MEKILRACGSTSGGGVQLLYLAQTVLAEQSTLENLGFEITPSCSYIYRMRSAFKTNRSGEEASLFSFIYLFVRIAEERRKKNYIHLALSHCTCCEK
jgi:hypothetical protein